QCGHYGTHDGPPGGDRGGRLGCLPEHQFEGRVDVHEVRNSRDAPARPGAIVNIASIYGFKPAPIGAAPYCASKFGVIGLSKTAAIDYAQQGIRVNVVAPGVTHSEMVDRYVEGAPAMMQAVVSRYSALNRIGDAAETAEAIAWLCSEAARFVNGAVLP